VPGLTFSPYLVYIHAMVVRLTDAQHQMLLNWGRAQGVSSVDDACQLLLAMLLECTGDPKHLGPLPARDNRPKTWNGVRVYSSYVRISPYTRSAKTRALWAWGAPRGEPNISAALRALIDTLGNLWVTARPMTENVAAFVEAVGLQEVHAA